MNRATSCPAYMLTTKSAGREPYADSHAVTRVRVDSLEDSSPARLADGVLAALVSGQATRASIACGGVDHVLELSLHGTVVSSLGIDGDRAAAMVARLAVAAGLNALAPAGTAIGSSNVARMRVSDGTKRTELVVSINATPRGFLVDLHVLAPEGGEAASTRGASLRRCSQCGAWHPANATRCRIDGARVDPVADDPRPGGTIGMWIVREELGTGGMGVVYAAEHALLGRKAAIKLMRRSLSDSRAIAELFLTEARAASRIVHEGIVAVNDFGVLPDGRPYVVMELLDGQPLYQAMGSDDLLSLGATLRIGRAIAEALGAAHEMGVVHHDLKPSNVMVLGDLEVERPRVKLVDFGAAAIGERTFESKTVYGTPQYMAPERVRGEVGDGRSDLYSLGVVLYEMIAGAAPFAHATATELLAAQVCEAPKTIARMEEEPLPDAIVRVVHRALAKNPLERYQSAREMIVDLDRALGVLDRSGWQRWLP